MIYLLLIYEFFKIGLFSFGGGYATIPFLYQLSVQYGWYTVQELEKMTAIASMTPGPVGINVATYAGIKTSGILGAIFATISEMLPSLLLVIIISKLLSKFKNNFYVKSAIESLKPISCALLTAIAVRLLQSHIFDIKAIILLIVLFLLSWKTKKTPAFYMFIGSIFGIIFAHI